MNPLAEELNTILGETVAGRLMSNLGRRLYFPNGIIAQSAEAKKSAKLANGTIGMACSNGVPLILSAVADNVTLSAEESVAYAPTAGVEKVRAVWKDLIIQKNPSLNPGGISLPVVVPGLTAGLSYAADLFFGRQDSLITSEPCWDNYGLIIETRRGAKITGVPFFGNGTGLDMDSIGAAIEKEAKKGVIRILFNFPNNPSGYSPTEKEAQAIVSMLKKAAENGADVLAICDDAYFGLFYEDGICGESLFSRLAGLHEKILAIKIDGPTKEDYVWGMRIGFLTFGSKGLGQNHYDALIKKMMGAIRSSASCANTGAQYLILKVLEDKRSPDEKKHFMAMLQQRYNLVKNFIKSNPNHPALKPMPFNSGYFMSFLCQGINAESLRRELLEKHGIGVISLGDSCLRVAFSSIDEDKIEETYRLIYDTAGKLN